MKALAWISVSDLFFVRALIAFLQKTKLPITKDLIFIVVFS